MSRYLAIGYGCDISRDPAQNTLNHQRMVDELNAVIAEDGWPGVKVTALETRRGFTSIQIEPGVSKLTLDYLRKLREAGRLPDAPPPEPNPLPPEGQQKLLL